MKKLPFTKAQIERIIQKYPTPFYIYNEDAIRKNAQSFTKALSALPAGSRNYFAIKVLPNPHILKIVSKEGMGMDASSYTELVLCEKLGIKGEDIMFSSNQTPLNSYKKAYKMGAVINFDDTSHIAWLKENGIVPKIGCIRYNPGKIKTKLSHGYIIGQPMESKFGSTKKQLFEGYALLKKLGVKRFGIHTMLANNELNHKYFVETTTLAFDMVAELSKRLDIKFEFINLGGGLGIPYELHEKPFDLKSMINEIKLLYHTRILKESLPPLRILMECGRYITGPHGYLISRVLHVKRTYKTYVGLDASTGDLMRPVYFKTAYHHISVMGKEKRLNNLQYDVVGGLCTNTDKLAQNRNLPQVEKGDIVVFHDVGAHGFSLGHNYNGKLRSAELLLRKNGIVKLIRRAETPEDLFRTIT